MGLVLFALFLLFFLPTKMIKVTQHLMYERSRNVHAVLHGQRLPLLSVTTLGTNHTRQVLCLCGPKQHLHQGNASADVNRTLSSDLGGFALIF